MKNFRTLLGMTAALIALASLSLTGCKEDDGEPTTPTPAVATSETISSFDFSTVGSSATAATLTSGTISNFDFSSGNKTFTVKIGTAAVQNVTLSTDTSDIDGLVAAIGTISGATVAKVSTSTFKITTTATGAAAAIVIGGTDAATFFGTTLTNSGAAAVPNANKNFTVAINGGTAKPVALTADLADIDGLVSAVQTAIDSSATPIATVAKVGTDKFKITTVATGAAATIEIGGTDKAEFFGTTFSFTGN